MPRGRGPFSAEEYEKTRSVLRCWKRMVKVMINCFHADAYLKKTYHQMKAIMLLYSVSLPLTFFGKIKLPGDEKVTSSRYRFKPEDCNHKDLPFQKALPNYGCPGGKFTTCDPCGTRWRRTGPAEDEKYTPLKPFPAPGAKPPPEDKEKNPKKEGKQDMAKLVEEAVKKAITEAASKPRRGQSSSSSCAQPLPASLGARPKAISRKRHGRRSGSDSPKEEVKEQDASDQDMREWDDISSIASPQLTASGSEEDV